MREMEMKYLKCFVFMFLYLYDRLFYIEAASLDSRLTALENVFHNQIFLLREMVLRDMQQRDIFTQKMNETLEFFEQFRNEILGSSKYGELKSKTEQLFTSNSDFGKEITDTLVRHARGLQEEKKARKKDKEDIVTQIREDKEDIITQIRGLLSAKVGEIKDDFKTDFARLELKLDAQQTERQSFEKEMKEQIRKLDQRLDVIADKQTLAIIYTREGIERVNNMTAVIVKQNSQIEIKTVDLIAEVMNIGQKCTHSEITTDTARTEGAFSPPRTYLTTTSYEPTTTREPVIRLACGTGPHEGRVELLYEGSYGTVCDDRWEDIDATVACRMLGYHSGTAFGTAHFGHGAGQILLDEVDCNGKELSLFDCGHHGIGDHDCGHSEDAGVRCIVN